MPPIKPGYQSTEFWMSFITSLIGMLVLANVIPAGDEPTLETLAAKIVAGVVASVTAWKYITSRTEIKNGKPS